MRLGIFGGKVGGEFFFEVFIFKFYESFFGSLLLGFGDENVRVFFRRFKFFILMYYWVSFF